MVIRTANGVIISKMTGKMRGFYSINTNPLDNPYCEKMSTVPGSICSQCYSRRMLKTTRKTCNPSWSQNGEILSREIIPDEFLPDLFRLACNGAFRFSSHGELINETHLINLCNIARRNPAVTFALWTKRIALVQKNLSQIPENMILVASSRWVDVTPPDVPVGFDKVFSAYHKEYAEQHKIPINCMGHCKECMTCYQKDNGVTHINGVLK